MRCALANFLSRLSNWIYGSGWDYDEFDHGYRAGMKAGEARQMVRATLASTDSAKEDAYVYGAMLSEAELHGVRDLECGKNANGHYIKLDNGVAIWASEAFGDTAPFNHAGGFKAGSNPHVRVGRWF